MSRSSCSSKLSGGLLNCKAGLQKKVTPQGALQGEAWGVLLRSSIRTQRPAAKSHPSGWRHLFRLRRCCTHLPVLPLAVGHAAALSLPGDTAIGAAAGNHRSGGAGATKALILVEDPRAIAFHQYPILAELVVEALIATLGADPAVPGQRALEDVELAVDLLAG